MTFEEALIEHCSPTLAGEKPASLFRFCLEEEFPHEIGVFLGYPLDDVKGFIRHKGRDYTFCGCWKCYGDPQAARRRFERYHRCTAVLRRRYAEGTPITQLIEAA